MKGKIRSSWWSLGLAFALVAGQVAADETLTQTKEETLSARGLDQVSFMNLAGEVTLSRASGSDLVIKATLSATGDDAEEAQEYLDLLKLEVNRNGSKAEVLASYPVHDHSRFAYSREAWDWGYNTTTKYMGERVTISSSRGLRLHVDFDVAVPDGVDIRFENKVGNIVAKGINSDIELDTSSGSIESEGGKGRLSADTGSGSVRVSDRVGDVIADTGSGSVEIRNVEGDVSADTGSGSIDLEQVTGNVHADTGSGSVDMADIEGDVFVDTGSGGVDGTRLSGVTDLEVDTGSGSVELDGDFSRLDRMRIDTGSGGVRMRTEGTLNMHLEVSAGSGGVEVNLPEMSNVHSRRGEFEADIGNGKGDGLIDTGSGGVRITNR